MMVIIMTADLACRRWSGVSRSDGNRFDRFFRSCSFADKIVVGGKFKMWVGRFMREGEIVEVLQKSNDHGESPV
jgi:hypothetical protein